MDVRRQVKRESNSISGGYTGLTLAGKEPVISPPGRMRQSMANVGHVLEKLDGISHRTPQESHVYPGIRFDVA